MESQTKSMLVNTGKQFYTWGTVGSFTGATAVVVLIWNVLRRLQVNCFFSEIVPLVISIFVMTAFALFTEPSKTEEITTWRQKGQKAIITLINSFLIYSAVLGFSGTVM